MPSGIWRKCRFTFRCFRISVWLLLLFAACLLLWCNEIGLPNFIKNPLLADLHKRGVNLTFAHIRLRMRRGIVADDVSVSSAGDQHSPIFSAREVQLLMNFGELLHRRLHIDGLVVNGGRLVAPMDDSKQPPATLEITNIQTELRFEGAELWSLDNFSADFKGARLLAAGDLAHPRELSNWGIFNRPKTPGSPGASQRRLQDVLRVLDAIHLQGNPWLTLNFEGDARNEHSFAIQLQITAPGTETPWFSAKDLKFKANFTIPKANHGPPLAGFWTNIEPYRLSWTAHFTNMIAETVTARAVDARGSWRTPEMSVDLHLHDAQRTAGYAVSVDTLQFNAHLSVATNFLEDPVLTGVWTNFTPCGLSWATHFERLKSPKMTARSVAARGSWAAPKLAVNSLYVDFGERGWLRAALDYHTDNQRLDFTNSSSFELSVLTPLLPHDLRRQLADVRWTTPPTLRLAGAVDLSDWLGKSARRAARPPATVSGDVAFTNTTISGVLLDTLQAEFAYSNRLWEVRGLRAAWKNSALQFSGSVDETAKTYAARIRGAFDLNELRPWLKSKVANREMGRLKFHDPLCLDVAGSGNLTNLGALAINGQLALTNFAARGGPMESLTTGLAYSNRLLSLPHVFALREHGSEVLSADAITVDLNKNVIIFTNGYSSAAPQVVADSIGPMTGKALEPYQFLRPPKARVNGWVSLGRSEGESRMEPEDLRMELLEPAPFRWLKLNAPEIMGGIRWFGDTLLLTNIDAQLYGGRAQGVAVFDFKPINGTDYQFAFDLTNASLHQMVAELASNPANKLEGLIAGRLVVTSGNSTNWQDSMNGYGSASLHDGLLWDTPVFGIFSPILNAINPGMGNSRATDAAAQFTMANGVIRSDALEIHTSMMRLHYDGTVDLHENLHARATFQVLRDTPFLGSVLKALLWPVTRFFEYKVSGTLDDPKMTPANDLAKLIVGMLHPVKSIERVIPSAGTNAPANPGKP